MCKRASVYFTRLSATTELDPEELGEAFDKIAASAIEADLNAAWVKLSSECPDDLLPWLGWQFSKMGYEMAQDAALEKEAIVGALFRGIGRNVIRGGAKGIRAGRSVSIKGQATAAGASAGTRAAGRDLASRAAKAPVRWRGQMGAASGAQRMGLISGAMKQVKVPGAAGRAARKNLAKQHQKAQADYVKGLSRKQKGGGALTPKEQKALNRARGREATSTAPAAAGGGSLPGTTAQTRRYKETPAAMAKRKNQRAAREAEQGAEAAARAARGGANLKVIPGGKGGGGGKGSGSAATTTSGSSSAPATAAALQPETAVAKPRSIDSRSFPATG